MKTHLITGAAAAALVLAAPAAAAQTSDRTPDARAASVADPALLEDVVVTANRSAQAGERVGQSVTVLTAGDIKESQTVAVADLLVRTPGVSLSRNGGVGATTSLRIRGAEADQTVVVIDGVKLNDPSGTGGGFNFGNLLVNAIGRIEVLRGAQSTLWGSQAIGGVVNIATARPTGPFEATLSAEAGSRGTRYFRGGVGGATGWATWRLAASRYETDGFSAFAAGSEDDGYENFGLSGRADVRLTDALSMDLRAVYSDGTVEIDLPSRDTRETTQSRELVTYAGVNLDLLDGRFSNRLANAYTRTNRLNENPDQAVTSTTFDAEGENRRWEYQGVFDLREGWTATFGAEHETSEFRTASPTASRPNPIPARAEVSIDGAYAQVQAEVVDGVSLTVGARRDEHETFGGRTLGQAAAAWSLNEGATILRASFGQGFKAPSLFQLYSDFGNLALEPEEADGWDAGVEQALLDGVLILSATYFARETTNQIDFVSCPATATAALCFRNTAPPGAAPVPVRRSGYYDNIALTEADGVEVTAALRAGGFSLDANYTETRTENRTPGANLGRRLARRPEAQANLVLGYAWASGLSASVAVQHAGDSFDNASNSVRLDGYTLFDLRAAYTINEALELYGRVENVGDEAYETIRNYGVAGRGAFFGVRARF